MVRAAYCERKLLKDTKTGNLCNSANLSWFELGKKKKKKRNEKRVGKRGRGKRGRGKREMRNCSIEGRLRALRMNE